MPNKYIYRSKFAGKVKIALLGVIDRLFPFVAKSHFQKVKASLGDEISKWVKICSTSETLQKISEMIISEIPGVYMRFGDGDVFLLKNKSEMYQRAGVQLSIEMKEAFELKGQGVLKALMIHSNKFGCESGMVIGNHLVNDATALDLLKNTYPFFVGFQIYSPIALHYMATYQPTETNLFLRLLKHKTMLFVGNENIPNNVIQKLFGSVPHVKTPALNSYEAIESIENNTVEVLNSVFVNYGVVVIAMGCSGRVLMKRLHRRNFPVFMFDFGSLLDGICGWQTRTWLREDIRYDVLLDGL